MDGTMEEAANEQLIDLGWDVIVCTRRGIRIRYVMLWYDDHDLKFQAVPHETVHTHIFYLLWYLFLHIQTRLYQCRPLALRLPALFCQIQL